MSTHTTKHLTLLTKSKRSQSALEYMMTYGWAILIIVIVAVILYSMGIFNPSSSVSSTVTGFSGLGSVTAECTANGVLRISVGDSTGNLINVTGITAKDPSITKTANFKPNSTVDPNPLIRSGTSYIFSVPNICPSAGTHYAITVAVNYTEPGQVLPGPYQSLGSITGTSTSTVLPPFVASFNGMFTPYGQTNPLSNINVNWVANQNYSISLWVNLNSVNSNQSFVYIASTGSMSPLGLLSGKFIGSVWGTADVIDLNPAAKNTWYNLVLSYDNVTQVNSLYVNGIFIGSSTGEITFPYQGYSEVLTLGYPSSGPVCIFFSDCRPDNGLSTISGKVSNFQFYNSALTQAEVSSTYSAGLLGKPETSASLFLWWPLNGTANDYSGNNNNGVSYNVVYTSNYPTTGLS